MPHSHTSDKEALAQSSRSTGAARRAAAGGLAAFEFAVEWPVGDIELNVSELDGAAIVAASSRSG